MQGTHDVHDSAHARNNGPFIEAQRLAGFVGDHRNAALAGLGAQALLDQPRVDDDGDREPARHFFNPRLVQRRSYLRQVVPMHGRGVQIDDVAAAHHDVVEKPARQARRDGPAAAAREGAIQIASVRKIAGLIEKAEKVDHRHQHQRAAQPVEALQDAQSADDLHAVEFIAVNRGAAQ